MINVAFTWDQVCRECGTVLVAGYGEVPPDMNQTSYEVDVVRCEDHPASGNRILVTVSRDRLPAIHGEPVEFRQT